MYCLPTCAECKCDDAARPTDQRGRRAGAGDDDGHTDRGAARRAARPLSRWIYGVNMSYYFDMPRDARSSRRNPGQNEAVIAEPRRQTADHCRGFVLMLTSS